MRRYYVLNTSSGPLVTSIDGLALWPLGIPAPLVWVIVAFITNFIPNIGFVLGVIRPAILALVIGSPPTLFVVIGVCRVVNVVLQVLVQPRFVSDTVDIILTPIFLPVAFWSFIIEPLGAILAMPLILLGRALLLENEPELRWSRLLSGDQV
ncbi:AI-2E family transporter [Leucobacter sp. USHLN154]|uniref:AI-2E family transporter n=1 Tax=Leucobacter sp. USHLN154 TaxID=3081269 RepID=UPI003017B565